MRKFALLSPLLSLLLLVACAARGDARPGAPTPATPTPAAAGPDDTLARIHALVGTPSCTEDSQCHSLPIGARPCGGPENYLAYSTVHTPEAELKALGAIYAAERRGANVQAGRMSSCVFMADPGAVCRAGACALGADQPRAR